jgi:hypothetical protein
MNPVWCQTPGFQDILELPSIAELSLNLRVNFAGDSIPSELKLANQKTTFKTTFNQIFKDSGLETYEFKAGVIRFYRRYQYECQQSLMLSYSCIMHSSIKILDNGIRGPPQEFYQSMHEDGYRLTKSASGFSLKAQAVAVIYHLSLSGFMVILGMFYFSTIICKMLLGYLFASSPQIETQKDANLDLAKHLKTD